MLFLEGKQQSGLISIAGVTAGLNAFVYAAAPGLRNTQIAVANSSGKTVRVKAGSDVSVPAHGIVIVEPKEPGVITVSAESPVAVTVLRNLLVSDTPRLLSSYPANLPSGLFFPLCLRTHRLVVLSVAKDLTPATHSVSPVRV